MSKKKHRGVLSQSLIPVGQSRWGSMAGGFLIQSLIVAVLSVIPFLIPSAIQILPHVWITPIEAPAIQPWRPQPRRFLASVPRMPKIVEEPMESDAIPPSKPAIISPVLSAPVKKPLSVSKPSAAETPEIAQEFPNQNLPSLGSSAIPTLRKPREEVQTGGFGDPNGVPNNRSGKSSPNIAQLGSYDVPNGPGNGNGSGGAKGAAGAAISTGFGNGRAGGPSSRGRGSIQQGMFADAEAATSTPKLRPTAVVASRTKPVQILSKPRPKYTEEARTKKIEGDVLLQVLFLSSGVVEVERIVRGLGFGLDESAQAAAREIRFEPALQEGRSVDSSAIVHITFALAY